MSQRFEIEIAIRPEKRQTPGGRRSVSNGSEPDPTRTPRIARLRALAIKFQEMVDRGEVQDYADLARLGYVSRARVTQIMNLLNLAPAIQEQFLLPASLTAKIRESHLRGIISFPAWTDQRKG